MNSDPSKPDVTGLDEDIVAYLDGELDDSASRRLEERLANDESARRRLRALAMSWDLLDNLPRAATDESFTRTTVELIAVEARKEIAAEQTALPARKRRRWIAAAAAAAAAAMIGFVAVALAWPDANEQLLRDLPVVRNFELYDVVPQEGAIEFLRQLEAKELFMGEAASETGAADAAVTGDEFTREELTVRRSIVEALSPTEKNELRKLYERFQTRPVEEQERFRELDIALRGHPEASRLYAVLHSYYNWLPTLAPFERANLLKMSSEDAIAEIQKLKQQQLRSFARSGGSRQGPLTTSDVEKIERWLQEWAWKNQVEILAKASPEDQEWYRKLPDDLKKRSLIFLTRQPGPPKPPNLNEEEWANLLSQLPTVKALFERAGKQVPDKLLQQFPSEVMEGIKIAVSKAETLAQKQNLLFGWYHRGQWARDAFGGAVSPGELSRFFDEDLSQKERDDLMSAALPPQEFNRRLRFMYHVKKELPPGLMRGFGKRGGWGGPKGGGRRGDEADRREFEGGRRGGSPEFNYERKQRRDREDHIDRDSERNRRRDPRSNDGTDTSTERRTSSKADE